MTDADFRELHDQIADFDDVEWIDDGTREIVELFMPELADKLPNRKTETFDQAFGRMGGAAGAETSEAQEERDQTSALRPNPQLGRRERLSTESCPSNSPMISSSGPHQSAAVHSRC
ncbi:hypothetical protein [Bradyrhizobium sp. STM 3557]|uniref:hypothetical protein n=1 Tax=Bradyrhizobium sp. STM 3557 TaxID=578920 RepID=UPI00388FD9CB